MSDAMEEIERLVAVVSNAAAACGNWAEEGQASKYREARAALLSAIRRALGAASVSDSAECAGAFQRGVEAAAEVLRGVVDSSEEDDRWDAIVAEAESQIHDLARRGLPRSSPGSASPGERRCEYVQMTMRCCLPAGHGDDHRVLIEDVLRFTGKPAPASSPEAPPPSHAEAAALGMEWLRTHTCGLPMDSGGPCPPGQKGCTGCPHLVTLAPASEAGVRCACGHFHGAGADGEDEGCKDGDCPCTGWRPAPAPVAAPRDYTAAEYEAQAEEFWRLTGFMAPGKDVAPAAAYCDEDEERRHRLWQAYRDHRLCPVCGGKGDKNFATGWGTCGCCGGSGEVLDEGGKVRVPREAAPEACPEKEG